MATLAAQFVEALVRVGVGDKDKRLAKTHPRVRAVLETSEQLRAWGIDTILIGSYSRRTAIYPGQDVDIFCKLTNLDIAANPNDTYEAVCQVLEREYKDSVTRRPRSCQIDFSDEGFHADVVPAVVFNSRWGIPIRDQEAWGVVDERDRWTETDPEVLGERTEELNKRLALAGRGLYVPVVRLMRQSRRHHLGKGTQPDGHYFELLTYWAVLDSEEPDSIAEIFAAALRGAANQLAGGGAIEDPCLDAPYAPLPDPDSISRAATIFSELADLAEGALAEDDDCAAAAAWRSVLGRNERGWCFPLPPGCDETGQRVPEVSGVRERGVDEARGFGDGRHS